MIQLARTGLNFEREPMAAPFGFKGGFLTEIWQTVARMESVTGQKGVGLGVQSILWSDAEVFARCSEAAGNCLMLLLSSNALRKAEESPFESPMDLLDRILPSVYAYGRTITQQPNLRLTFALNALVAVDNAAWMLYAMERKITRFDDLIPQEARPALSHHHREIISVPAIGYGMTLEEIQRLVEAGYFLLKIKIGSDPDQDGDPEKMLEWDKARLAAIHTALQDQENSASSSGRVQYYLDANGRYDSRERILRLLDFTKQIGALDRTILLEEPFPEALKIDVRDFPVRVVADESAHTERDAAERMDLGYGAIALKPIAKTLSMSFRIAQLAFERGVPCFCADLTVNPVLVDWNKTLAARLAPLPGMTAGILENNGFQNYRDWDRMTTYHPCHGAAWTKSARGVFTLSEDFYAQSGGLFLPAPHYASL
jgi:L-alanine-DL-glutamate epimerase-like enolase superfamily enzyme